MACVPEGSEFQAQYFRVCIYNVLTSGAKLLAKGNNVMR